MRSNYSVGIYRLNFSPLWKKLQHFCKLLKPAITSFKNGGKIKHKREGNAHGNIIPYWNQWTLDLITLHCIYHVPFPPPEWGQWNSDMNSVTPCSDYCMISARWDPGSVNVFKGNARCLIISTQRLLRKFSSMFILITLVFRVDRLQWFYHSPGMAETHWKEKSPISLLLRESIGKALYQQKAGGGELKHCLYLFKVQNVQVRSKGKLYDNWVRTMQGQPFLYCLEIPCS